LSTPDPFFFLSLMASWCNRGLGHCFNFFFLNPPPAMVRFIWRTPTGFYPCPSFLQIPFTVSSIVTLWFFLLLAASFLFFSLGFWTSQISCDFPLHLLSFFEFAQVPTPPALLQPNYFLFAPPPSPGKSPHFLHWILKDVIPLVLV